MRRAIARGSTRANFSPSEIFAIARIDCRVSGVGAPVTVIDETEKMEDQAKR